ncbi:CPBP family intramembrane glutamic endopeptidase [Demequina sp. NBRC 110054]|uniref:CPBP family intramembrane glutamic endopeptidase n=1 Tax=Demequina sp. NBRC 110054 TaxID=1570343 RepID=UPI001356563D|nr:CPBP family intramembrane glutamic endopeptidase [Demequina sp. NBRC 110054]
MFVLGSESERLFPDTHAGLHLAQVHAFGTAIVLLAIWALRWWRPVFVDDVPARRWLWAPSLAIVVVAIALADYGRISEAGLSAFAALALGTLFIAFGEELMFRGVLVHFLRARWGELTVMLVSSAVFGLAHFLAGPVQIVFSFLLGIVLYTARRVSGGLILPIAVHLLWDLSVFTSFLTTDPAEGSDASFALALVNIVGVVAILALWRKVAPKQTGSVAPVSEGDRA